jgi:hypothetical protein
MTRNQLSFFATKADLESLLRAVESERPLQFVLAGLFDSPQVQAMNSLLNVPTMGFAPSGDSNHEPRYLVAHRDLPIEVRSVPQRRGGMKYSVDQQTNQKTIVFLPGGVCEPTCLIAGQVGTISEDATSLELFQLFSRTLRREFAKIKSDYVGKEAGELLDKGWRLTANAKSPPLYDLKRN